MSCEADAAFEKLRERNPDVFRRFAGGMLTEAEAKEIMRQRVPAELSRSAEDLAAVSTVDLRIHDADYGTEVELEGNWIGALLEQGSDEFGPYFTVKMRPSRFRQSRHEVRRPR